MLKVIGGLIIALIGALSPLAVGLIKNTFWVGYSFVEALVFMWAFNYAAPIFNTHWYNILPVVHVEYWFVLSMFLLIGFIGNFIKKLTPTIVKVSNNSESKTE